MRGRQVHDIGLGTLVFSATTVTGEEMNRSPVLRALLPESARPARSAIVLVRREHRQETLVIDGAYLEFAHAASLLDGSALDQLDLPRQALIARINGWPDSWDTAALIACQPRQHRGVWEFPSDRYSEGDHPLR